VLPPGALPNGADELVAGIAAELRWASEHLLTEGVSAATAATAASAAAKGVTA
jgi:hypothetical protein